MIPNLFHSVSSLSSFLSNFLLPSKINTSVSHSWFSHMANSFLLFYISFSIRKRRQASINFFFPSFSPSPSNSSFPHSWFPCVANSFLFSVYFSPFESLAREQKINQSTSLPFLLTSSFLLWSTPSLPHSRFILHFPFPYSHLSLRETTAAVSKTDQSTTSLPSFFLSLPHIDSLCVSPGPRISWSSVRTLASFPTSSPLSRSSQVRSEPSPHYHLNTTWHLALKASPPVPQPPPRDSMTNFYCTHPEFRPHLTAIHVMYITTTIFTR